MKRGTIVATNDDAHINTLHITACRDRAQFLLISTFLVGELSEAHSPLGWRSRSRPELTPAAAASGRYLYMSVMEEPIIPLLFFFLDNVGRLHFPPRRIL
jgi:hypothetical protein